MTCINLHRWEVLALNAGASALVRPVKLPEGMTATAIVQSRADPMEWVAVVDCGRGVGRVIKAPISPNSALIGREVWRPDHEMTSEKLDRWGVRFRADDVFHAVYMWGDWAYNSRTGQFWRSAATLPAALARHRYPVVSVVPKLLVDLDYYHWRRAGIVADHDQNVVEFASQQWEQTYGADSWSGWVWVIHLNVRGDGNL